jgi:hypothetical protein
MDGQRVSGCVCTLAIHHRESNGERASKNPTIFSLVLYFVRLMYFSLEKYIIRPGCITSTPQFHNSQPRHRTFYCPLTGLALGVHAHTPILCTWPMYHTWPASTILYGYCAIYAFVGIFVLVQLSPQIRIQVLLSPCDYAMCGPSHTSHYAILPP